MKTEQYAHPNEVIAEKDLAYLKSHETLVSAFMNANRSRQSRASASKEVTQQRTSGRTKALKPLKVSFVESPIAAETSEVEVPVTSNPSISVPYMGTPETVSVSTVKSTIMLRW